MPVEAIKRPQEAGQTLEMAKNRRKLLFFTLLLYLVGMDTAHVDHESGSEHHRGHAELAADRQLALAERMFNGADSCFHSGTKILTRLLHRAETLAFQSDIDLALVEVENGFASLFA